MQMTDRTKPKHYLISVDAPPIRLHAYLMTTDKRQAMEVVAKMESIAEQLGLKIWPGIFLHTHLSTGAGLVRKIMAEGNPQVAERIKTSKNYHLTIISLPPDHPNDKRLMELH